MSSVALLTQCRGSPLSPNPLVADSTLGLLILSLLGLLGDSKEIITNNSKGRALTAKPCVFYQIISFGPITTHQAGIIASAFQERKWC